MVDEEEKDEEDHDDEIECRNADKHLEVGHNRTLWTTDSDGAEEGDWICSMCTNINIDLLQFIGTKIEDTKSEEGDWVKFVLRELVQNADDAGSSRLVVRLDSDEMIVINDGEPFSEGEVDHFEKIKKILNRTKEDDKKTTGNFGSGFQTVYALTNKPEIHSGGGAIALNPVTAEPENIEPRFSSIDKGAMFIFPWRDDEAANKIFVGNEAPFEDISTWPRWQVDFTEEENHRHSIKRLYDFFKDYLEDVILACRNLESIRIIKNLGDEKETYQVVREDYRLEGVIDNIGKIKEGNIDWYDDFYEEDELLKEAEFKDEIERKYLLKSGKVRDEEDRECHIIKRSDDEGSLEIYKGSDIPEDSKEIKVNTVYVGLTLQMYGDRRYIYSVIPLPKKSPNRFFCSAHLFPGEKRKDIHVEGIEGRWYAYALTSIKDVYIESLDDLISHLEESGISDEEKQQTVLDNLPNSPLNEWMRTGRDKSKHEKETWFLNEEESLKEEIFEKRLVVDDGRMIPLNEAYYTEEDHEEKILKGLGEVPINESIKTHENFKDYLLEKVKKDIRLTPPEFEEIWKGFREEQDELFYGEYPIDSEFVMNLCTYLDQNWDSLDHPEEIEAVPDREDKMRPLTHFFDVPDDFSEKLERLFPPSLLIKKDIEDEIKQRFSHLMTQIDEGKKEKIPYLIDIAADKQPERFRALNDDDHQVISEMLIKLCEEGEDFSISKVRVEDGELGTHEVPHDNPEFIPYKHHNKIKLGSLNTNRSSGKIINDENDRTAATKLRQDAIFKALTEDINLPQDILDGIRFLVLKRATDEGIKDVQNALRLVRLFSKGSEGRERAFAIVFLSDANESIFFKDRLKALTKIEEDDKLHDLKKRLCHGPLKEYFKGGSHKGETGMDNIDTIPCIYNHNEEWYPPEEFAINLPKGHGREFFGYEQLHTDFDTWENETLKNLGAKTSPSLEKFEEKISELSAEPEENREELGWIAHYLSSTKEILDDREPVDIGEQSTLREFRDVRWIPTQGGGFAKSGEAVFPSDENVKILGEGSSYLLDLDFDTDLAERLKRYKDLEDESFSKRLGYVGISTEPDVTMIIDVVKEAKRSDSAPPEGSLAAIGKRLVVEEIAQDIKEEIEEIGYYDASRWYQPSDIILTDDPQHIPEKLKENHLVNPHETFCNESKRDYIRKYLEVAGPLDFTPSKILDKILSISNKDEAISDDIWSYLKSKLDNISEENKKELMDSYGNKRIIKTPLGKKSPENIILSDDETFILKESDYIKMTPNHILMKKSDDDLDDVLLDLGAKNRNYFEENLEELKELIIEFDGGCAYESIDKQTKELSLRMIRFHHDEETTEVHDKDDFYLPARKGSTDVFKMVRFSECVLIDDNDRARFLAEKFDDTFFFATDLNGEQDYTLRDFAMWNDMDFLKKSIKVKVKAHDCERDQDIEKKLSSLSDAIRDHLVEISYHGGESKWTEDNPFAVWSSLDVKRTDQIILRYELKNDSFIDDESMFFLDEEDSVLYLLPDITEDIVDDISEELLDFVSIDYDDSLPRATNKGRLRYKISTLLNQPSRTWQFMGIEGLRDGDYGEEKPLATYAPQDLPTRTNYIPTRKKLRGWYPGCQICDRRTPDKGEEESREAVRCIFSLRGGNYPKGDVDEYKIGNTLYLCPYHSTLFERGLIEIEFLDLAKNRPKKARKRIEEALKEYENDNDNSYDEIEDIVTSYGESYSRSGDDVSINKDHDDGCDFKIEHLKAFLEECLEYTHYIEKRE